MEDTLGDSFIVYRSYWEGLNPCFNGRYSRRKSSGRRSKKPIKVLILVLMEDTLGVRFYGDN